MVEFTGYGFSLSQPLRKVEMRPSKYKLVLVGEIKEVIDTFCTILPSNDMTIILFIP